MIEVVTVDETAPESPIKQEPEAVVKEEVVMEAELSCTRIVSQRGT